LTSRGFDVTGTGDATSFAYTNSVIEYSSAADMAEVNTLEQELSNVTDLQDASLTPGTVELILGSDYSGLKPAAQSSPSPTAAATSPAASSAASASASPSASAGSSASASGSPSASATGISGLAQSNGGITAAAACASDSSAFAGPLSP